MFHRSRHFPRLRALTAFLLASTATQSSAYAQEFPKAPPTNASECADILAEVIAAVVISGNSAGDFMRETNADNILRDYCARGLYEQAYQYGKDHFDGFMELNTSSSSSSDLKPECKVERGAIGQWKVLATAERYYLTQSVLISSLDENRVRSGSAVFVVAGKPSEPGRELRLGVQFVGTFNPVMLDVEIKDTAGGEPKRASVPVETGQVLNLTVPGASFAGNATLEISGSFGGVELFLTRVIYKDVHQASFAVYDDIDRLKQRRRRGRCVDRQCFLTTACCDLIGLDDDCFELRTLRNFRDRALPSLPGGSRDVALYYAAAPVILEAMRRTGSERALLRYYLSHILPCAVLAHLGFHERTRRLYRGLMRRLVATYAPEIAL